MEFQDSSFVVQTVNGLLLKMWFSEHQSAVVASVEIWYYSTGTTTERMTNRYMHYERQITALVWLDSK